MTRYLLATVLFLLVGYGLMEAWPLILGPSLRIDSPRDGAPFPEGLVTVRGKAERIAMLSLDGTPVTRDEDGSFETTLTFPHGGSILTFIATDRFGGRVTVTRSIYVPD
jgi:hypothetical protein